MGKANAAKVKNDAAKYLKRGKLDKALESYTLLEKLSPNDLKVPQKVAEILLKMGQKEQACNKYKDSAKLYYDKGFLIQAIAIYKVVLDINPDDGEVKGLLEKLMEERTGGPSSAVAGAGGGAHHHEPSTPVIPLKKKFQPHPEPKAAEPEPQPIEVEPIEPEPEEEDEEAAVAVGGDDEVGTEIDLDGDEDENEVGDEDEGAIELEVSAADEVDDEEEPGEMEEIDIIPVEEEEDLPPAGPEKTPLFSDLEPGEFDRVFELLESTVANKGEVIIEEDQEGDSLYIIARGQVKVTKKDADGKVHNLALLGPGDFFGEIGYFHGDRRASVTASKRCLLLEISKANLDEVVREFPRVKEVLIQFYRERVLDLLLANSPLFEKLSPSERKEIGDKFRHRELEPGSIIVQEGDPGDSMFLIKSGTVKVQTRHPVSKEPVLLAKLKGGDFFGEVSLIKNKPRTATVLADGNVEILELKRSDFEDISLDHPEIGKALEQTIERRVEQTIKKMMKTMES